MVTELVLPLMWLQDLLLLLGISVSTFKSITSFIKAELFHKYYRNTFSFVKQPSFQEQMMIDTSKSSACSEVTPSTRSIVLVVLTHLSVQIFGKGKKRLIQFSNEYSRIIIGPDKIKFWNVTPANSK